MCKTVYLTTRSNAPQEVREFRDALGTALRAAGIETVERSTALANIFRRHRLYGVAVAVDVYRNKRGAVNGGGGLILARRCSPITREFAIGLCDATDRACPDVPWREFRYVDGEEDSTWYNYFNRVSANAKVLIYGATYENAVEMERWTAAQEDIVREWTAEIIRLLRSDWEVGRYRNARRRARSRAALYVGEKEEKCV